jgi:predicted HTH transcriptional regulator
MTTEDYLLLASLFRKKGTESIEPSRFKHLAELEIVKFTERGIELINNDTILPIDYQSTATDDWQSIDTGDRKKQILAFIVNNDKVTTSQLAKLTGLTQGRIRTILQELASDGFIDKIGNYRHTSYIIKNYKNDKPN